MKPLLVHVARVIVILWCFRAGAQHVRAVKVVTEVYTTSVTIEPPGFDPMSYHYGLTFYHGRPDASVDGKTLATSSRRGTGSQRDTET